jgi:hypothetical protein
MDFNGEATAEISQVFKDKLLEGYDLPTCNTIDPALYVERPIRYQLDNLLSALDKVHTRYVEVMRPSRIPLDLTRSNDLISKKLRSFLVVTTKATDETMASIFYKYCMESSPRVAWWAASSVDWIGSLAMDSISFSAWATSNGNKTIPALPIGVIYSEAIELRMRAESDPDVLEPEDSTLPSKIAKYLYGVMKESINVHHRDELTPGDEARIKQCNRKLNVLNAALELAVGEDEDFLDVLLSMLSTEAIKGPDGEKISVKSIRKALGGVVNSSMFHDIIKAIPTAMDSSHDIDTAKRTLLSQPAIQRLMGKGVSSGSVETIFDTIAGKMDIFSSAPTETTAAGSTPTLLKMKMSMDSKKP